MNNENIETMKKESIETMSRKNIAITLYNVRNELEKDFYGTLDIIAGIGYQGVQLSGFSFKEHDPAALKSKLDKLNIKAAGSHASFEDLLEDPHFYINYVKTVGTPYIVCPYLSPEWTDSAEGYKRAAGHLNNIGKVLKENGIVFGYHNHAFEFEKFDGKYGLDILMENTDPGLVTFEPDVYWIRKGNENIMNILRKYKRKCPLVHIKDMDNSPERNFCEIGEGIIDFREVFDAEKELAAVWFIVEQDDGNKPAIESAKISFNNLKKMGVC